MIKINLLPSKITEQRKKRDFIIFVGVCAVCVLIICYILNLSLNQTIYPLEIKLAELQARIEQYDPTLREINSVKAENVKLGVQFDVLRGIAAKQSYWPRVLYGIHQSLSDAIWLEEIKSDAGQDFIEIEGRSLNKTIGVAEFIRNLEKSRFFSEITFNRFAQQEMFGKQVMVFQIRCYLAKDWESG